MFADEPRDAAPVPERAPGEPPPVGLGLVLVPYDRAGDVPALPAGLRRAVLQVDVLAVEAERGIESAELVEHRPAQEQEAAEHPVDLHGLVRQRLVEVEVAALRDDAPE